MSTIRKDACLDCGARVAKDARRCPTCLEAFVAARPERTPESKARTWGERLDEGSRMLGEAEE